MSSGGPPFTPYDLQGNVIGAVQTKNDLTGLPFDFTATAEQTIVPAVANQTVRPYRLRIYSRGALDLTIRDAVGGNILEVVNFPGAGSLVLDSDSRPYWTTAVGGALTFQASAATRITGRIDYTQG